MSKTIGRMDTLLASHYPAHLAEATDVAIRERYANFFPRENMLPAA